jgi:hypothetical protein
VENHYRMLSMSFTVRSVDAAFADALAWHLEPFKRATPEQHAFPADMFVREEDEGADPVPYSFFFATSFGIRHANLPDVLRFALWRVNAGVQERVRDYLLLHAGAVARDGGVVLLPAKMESGKSSTVVALLESGFSYLSDEFGAIDPISNQAYPVPKTIHLDWETVKLFPGLADRLRDKEGMNRDLAQRFVRPEDVGAGTSGPGPVRSIVFITSEFEGPPRLTPVSSAQAVEDMAATSFNLFRYGERGVILLSRIAKEAPAFRLEGGTPQQRAELLGERLT